MDLAHLKEKYPESERTLSRKEEVAKAAKMLLDLRENAGIQLLEETLKNKINVINQKLLSDEEMTREERSELLVERRCWMWFVGTFPNAKQTIQSIKHFVKKYE